MRIAFVSLTVLLAACQTNPNTADDWSRDAERVDAELIDVVSFETGCPKPQISIVERPDDDRGEYEVEACDQDLVYRRSDSAFYSL